MMRGEAEVFLAPRIFRLTRSERIVLHVIMTKPIATKEMIYAYIYGPDSPVHQKILDVFLCKIRRKLMPFQVRIETSWGRGFFMTPETKAQVRRMLAEEMSLAA